MIPILKELKLLADLHGLSPSEVARYVGVSEGTAYNWIVYERSSPGAIYRERIRRAIRKIKREFETGLPLQEIKRYYRAIEPRLTAREKSELLDIVSESGGAMQTRYLERLKALAEKYGVAVSK